MLGGRKDWDEKNSTIRRGSPGKKPSNVGTHSSGRKEGKKGMYSRTNNFILENSANGQQNRGLLAGIQSIKKNTKPKRGRGEGKIWKAREAQIIRDWHRPKRTKRLRKSHKRKKAARGGRAAHCRGEGQ